MRLLERIKRWLPRSFESVAAELVEGLENGTIVLDTPASLAETDAGGAEPESTPAAPCTGIEPSVALESASEAPVVPK